ncbi:MAG: leucine-rich repeats and death domain containing 1 [Stictis urceolatum]|nr:leucine-rich repeats and death domain containing 1 [Stictis urceolata]
MEPPSSPPALPGDAMLGVRTAEDTLPPPSYPRFPRLSCSRKRNCEEISYDNSSDPAVFSSDDHHVSLDDYSDKRKKRTLVGTWWKAEEAPKRRAKRVFERNFDSGVFIPSESSAASSDSLDVPSDPSLPEPASREFDLNAHTQSSHSLPKQSPPPSSRDSALASDPSDIIASTDEMGIQEDIAAGCIYACIEHGNPIVDLSDCGLEDKHVNSEVMKNLKLIYLRGPPGIRPTAQEYRPLLPYLELYLSNNRLTQLPREIFTMRNLIVLGIRNNDITSIPPQIMNLTELRTLNISVNKLNYLPASMRGLLFRGGLHDVTLRDNPFYSPVSPNPAVDQPYFVTGRTMVARSMVCFFGPTGRAISQENPPPSKLSTTAYPRNQMYPENYSASLAPSLMEIVLRQCDTSQIVALLSTMEPDACIDNLKVHVQREADARVVDLQACDQCGKRYAIPRAEWLEWWSGLSNTRPIPFLKQVCSHACAMSRPNENGIDKMDWEGCGWTEDEERHYDTSKQSPDDKSKVVRLGIPPRFRWSYV